MIERLAKVIYERSFEDDWQSLNPKGIERALYLEVAHAAIEAMREPTQAMLGPDESELLKATYQSMIDAALKQE